MTKAIRHPEIKFTSFDGGFMATLREDGATWFGRGDSASNALRALANAIEDEPGSYHFVETAR